MKLRFTIVQCLVLNFGLIFIAAIISLISIYSTHKKSENITIKNVRIYDHSSKTLIDLSALINETMMMVESRIFIEKEKCTHDKQNLKYIHSTSYPELKTIAESQINHWDKKDQIKYESDIASIEDSICNMHKKIMTWLNTFEKHENPMV